MKVQLSRLFGAESKIAMKGARSEVEWRHDLNLVLAELWSYVISNVETDTVHRVMLQSGFHSAGKALLTDQNFWPGYVEGITRIMLCLLGNYPDHRKRKAGSKKNDHYHLGKGRSAKWLQTQEQKLHMLFWTAPAVLELSASPLNLLNDFRDEVGPEAPVTDFLGWYKKRFPEDYLKVF